MSSEGYTAGRGIPDARLTSGLASSLARRIFQRAMKRTDVSSWIEMEANFARVGLQVQPQSPLARASFELWTTEAVTSPQPYDIGMGLALTCLPFVTVADWNVTLQTSLLIQRDTESVALLNFIGSGTPAFAAFANSKQAEQVVGTLLRMMF